MTGTVGNLSPIGKLWLTVVSDLMSSEMSTVPYDELRLADLSRLMERMRGSCEDFSMFNRSFRACIEVGCDDEHRVTVIGNTHHVYRFVYANHLINSSLYGCSL